MARFSVPFSKSPPEPTTTFINVSNAFVVSPVTGAFALNLLNADVSPFAPTTARFEFSTNILIACPAATNLSVVFTEP